MSVNVRINRFRAHSAFAKNKPNPENLPRRMTTPEEITSISALYSVQKYCSKIEEIIQNMRKLCPLHAMDFFFTSYAEYKNHISSVVDQSNMILRKLSPTFQNPTYQTGEDLRSYHEEFLTAVSHMNLQKQPVYFNAVTELMNKLPLDLDKFLQKYRKNAQVRQYLLTFEPKFREKIRSLDQDIRTILLPIEFEHLDFDRVFGFVERLRSIHRTFEITLMTTVKQRYGTEKRKSSLNSSFPQVKETEWNSTIIALIPILSNLPMFIENANSLNESIPDLTLSIEKLCLEIDDLLPRCEGFEEALPKKSAVTNETDDKVEKILQKASTILDMNLNRDQSKVDKLDAVVGKVENTINQLKSQIDEVTKEKEKVQLDFDRSNIVKRFQRIREASDDIAKKFENDKENFLMTVIDKLRVLVDFNFTIEENDPYRMFNAVYKQLCKEFDQLKRKSMKDKNNNTSNHNGSNDSNSNNNGNNSYRGNSMTNNNIDNRGNSINDESDSSNSSSNSNSNRKNSNNVGSNNNNGNNSRNSNNSVSNSNRRNSNNSVSNSNRRNSNNSVSSSNNDGSNNNNDESDSSNNNNNSNSNHRNSNNSVSNRNNDSSNSNNDESDGSNNNNSNRRNSNNSVSNSNDNGSNSNIDESDSSNSSSSGYRRNSNNGFSNNNNNRSNISNSDDDNSSNRNNNGSNNNDEYRDSFIKLCAKLTHKDKSEFINKTPDELNSIVYKAFEENKNDDLNLIDIDKLMSLIPVKCEKDNYLDNLKDELKKMDYSLEAVEPFNYLTSKLNSLLDSDESCFLPMSNSFSDYLDSLAKMKDNLTKLKPELMHKPIHSLLVQSVELFNSLAITLSSASFAPEFAENQKSIQSILDENQNLNISLARLRILLEERDVLLQAETRKLAKLEKQFSSVVKENLNSNESVDTQKLINSIETRESESDFF